MNKVAEFLMFAPQCFPRWQTDNLLLLNVIFILQDHDLSSSLSPSSAMTMSASVSTQQTPLCPWWLCNPAWPPTKSSADHQSFRTPADPNPASCFTQLFRPYNNVTRLHRLAVLYWDPVTMRPASRDTDTQLIFLSWANSVLKLVMNTTVVFCGQGTV